MARNKVKLAWISNDAARRATYKKRKKGVMKKTSELSTLCGTDACAIVYGPYEPQPEVWPHEIEGVTQVLNRFLRLPEIEKSKKMVNQEGYLRQRVSKVHDQLKKMEREGRDVELAGLLFDCLRGRELFDLVNIPMVSNLLWLLDNKMRQGKDRLQPRPTQSALRDDINMIIANDQVTADTHVVGGPTALPSDGAGAGHELLVYPPHLLSAPEDMGHAYVHHPKPLQ